MKFLHKLPFFAPTFGIQVYGIISKHLQSWGLPGEMSEFQIGCYSGMVPGHLKNNSYKHTHTFLLLVKQSQKWRLHPHQEAMLVMRFSNRQGPRRVSTPQLI